ncbi:MAG TPA: ATP-dependent helicase, partial [Firmicutes bacterium]|nr:ATP-dependent helicase [Bacillota bacterium]
DNKLLLDSPFDTKNLNLMINDSLSIAYQDRDKSLNGVINNIKAFIDEKKGNYLIFVPSYEYLYKLKSGLNFDKEYNVIYQKKSMTNLEKSSFLEAFTENPRKTTIGIAVIGGSFSEGIDLVNDRLIGVIIIGIGLPSFDYESKILRNYYDKNNLDGFNYTYVNPAMNRVMQAVGRLIRSENDRGSVLLIDSRYLHKKYLNLFRNEWKNYKVVKNSDEIKKVLREFYKN